jgi:hypothetical protein
MLQTVPALFWSGMPIFVERMLTDYTPSSSVWDTVDHLAGLKSEGSALAPATAEKPEVVLAFTYDKLRTDLVQRNPEFEGVVAAFEGAASQLSVPYVVRDSQRAVAGHSCKDAAAYIEGSGVLSNGVADLVSINVDGATVENDREVAQIVDMVAKATNGRYVAMVTANNTVPSEMVLEFGAKEVERPMRRRLTYAQQQQRQIPLTPGILTGLLVGGLLLVIFLNGFCCLFALQTPKKFEHE